MDSQECGDGNHLLHDRILASAVIRYIYEYYFFHASQDMNDFAIMRRKHTYRSAEHGRTAVQGGQGLKKLKGAADKLPPVLYIVGVA